MSYTRSASTILLVEDEQIVALSEKQIIARHGHEVVVAGSGEEAIAITRSRDDIDLILMDIDLGSGIDGTEAAERILRDRDLPIVFLSGHHEREIVERTRDLTGYGYVVKNSGEFVLLESIRMAEQLFAAHQRSRRSEAQLRAQFDTAEDAIVAVDTSGRVVLANRAVCEIAGLPQWQVEGRLVDEFYPQYAPEVRRITRSCLDEQTPLEFSFEATVRPEVTRAYRCRCVPVNMAPHGLPCAQFHLSEIPEEVKPSGLTTYDSLLPAITRNAPGFLFRLARPPRGRFAFSYVSEGVSRHFGYSAKKIIEDPGTLIRALPAGDQAALKRALHRSSARTEQLSETVRLIASDGTEHWVRVQASVNRPEDGSFVWTGICLDVTDEARAVMALRIREEQYRKLAEQYRFLTETTDELVCLHDPDGVYRYVSPSCRLLLGYEPDELIGTSPYEYIHPDDAPRIRKDAHDQALAGRVVGSVVYRLRRKNGLYVWLDTSTDSVTDENGRIVSMITKSRDVTERIAAEEQIKKALQETEFLVREMNHRIKNNLAMIGSLLALKESSSELPLDLSDVTSRIDAIRLLHDLMHRSESAKQVNVRPYLEGILDAAFGALGAEDVSLNASIEAVFVSADTALPLALIVNEAATNAVKHGLPFAEEKRFNIDFVRSGDAFRLSVANTGPAIRDQHDSHEGSGMGIRLIELLSEQLSGELEITTTANPVITVTFPVEMESDAASAST